MGRRLADLGPERFVEALGRIRQMVDDEGSVIDMAAHFSQPGVMRSTVPSPVEVASDMFHGYLEDQYGWNRVLDRMKPQGLEEGGNK